MPDKRPDMEWYLSSDNSIDSENIFRGNCGFSKDNVSWFQQCYNISDIQGHNLKYPAYLVEDSFKRRLFDVSNPFTKEKIPFIKSLFSYFAYDKVEKQMTDWQKKKEYETTAQWKERVTEDTQKIHLAKVIEELRKEYIAKKAPETLKGEIGVFDADYGVFPITAKDISNTFYVQVPIADAPVFKENWSDVIMTPEYGVVDDQLAVLSCTFNLNGKTYQSTKNYSNDNTEDMAISLPPLEINLSGRNKQRVKNEVATIDNSLDMDVPIVDTNNDKTFAVIIGNENYQKVSKVQFAQNDANTFAAYCQKTLGLPQKNVRIYKDATYATMLAAIDDIKNVAKAYKGDLNVIFYYAGHGIPNESSCDAYLLPIDTDGRNTEVCYPLRRLYSELGGIGARSVTVFMDACFSGGERGDNMLMAARGVAIKAKAADPHGNMVVFSAASNDETAYPYKEKGHGLFTYFLLKKLQETKGNVTLGELGNYIIDNVSKESIVSNGKSQTPTVVPSVSIGKDWERLKLK